MANHTSGGNAAHPSHIPPSSAPSGSPHRWKVLWATFLSYFFNSFDLTVLAIVMPVMLKALALTLPEGGLLGTATMLGAMLGSILFGLISENRGRRFALVLALCWLGIGMGGAYFINGWLPWMVLRFVTGLAIVVCGGRARRLLPTIGRRVFVDAPCHLCSAVLRWGPS